MPAGPARPDAPERRVTIGQSPRDDVVPEIIAQSGTVLDVTERGVLDGLDDAMIADLAPRTGEERWYRLGAGDLPTVAASTFAQACGVALSIVERP